MLDKLVSLLGSSEHLLETSRHDCLEMVRTAREMFLISTEALRGDITDEVWNRIARMDQEINRQQMNVRRNVFSHLAVARSSDLLTGLQLTSVVVDIERVGDYIKNIAELAMSTPAAVDFGAYSEGVERTERDMIALFDLTHDAIADADAKAANEVMVRYREMSVYCDRSLEEILIDSPDEGVERSLLVLVLHLRYLKRVGAHLKNAASVIVNPYHRIGYDSAGAK